MTAQMTGCEDKTPKTPEQKVEPNTEITNARSLMPGLKDKVEQMTLTSQRMQRRHYIVSFNSVDPLIEDYNKSLMSVTDVVTKVEDFVNETYRIEGLFLIRGDTQSKHLLQASKSIKRANDAVEITAGYMHDLELEINKFNVEFDLNDLKSTAKYKNFADQSILAKSADTIETALRENRPDDAINASEQLKSTIN